MSDLMANALACAAANASLDLFERDPGWRTGGSQISQPRSRAALRPCPACGE